MYLGLESHAKLKHQEPTKRRVDKQNTTVQKLQCGHVGLAAPKYISPKDSTAPYLLPRKKVWDNHNKGEFIIKDSQH